MDKLEIQKYLTQGAVLAGQGKHEEERRQREEEAARKAAGAVR